MIRQWLQRRREDKQDKEWAQGFDWATMMINEYGIPADQVRSCIIANHDTAHFKAGAHYAVRMHS